MKSNRFIILTLALGATTLGAPSFSHAQTNKPATSALNAADVAARAAILARGREVVDAHLPALESNPKPTTWEGATMWIGLAEFAKVSGRPQDMNAIRSLGEREKWGFPKGGRPFNADFDAIGQTYLAYYERRPAPEILRPVQGEMDALVTKLNSAPPDANPVIWTWCDTLFMAPAVLSQMSQITGDRKYIDAMDKEWWRASARLYDAEEHLFFRDAKFLDRKTANGHKVFWSRGNGWVLAGLARVLSFMPADYPTRPRYEQQFREMAARLQTLQGKDGMWRASLLDAAQFPQPESSGTAFFCYGMAWGVNNSLLPRADYEPTINKAWSALVALRRDDNIPGFVQSGNNQPAYTQNTSIGFYGTGGFLLAATEMARMKPSPAIAPAEPRALVRLVPERLDDIAWENDRIGFRIYGPRLEAREKTGSGIDVWAKSTRRMVLGAGDWYAGKYHQNSGEGADFYAVGQTRGCGGLGVWDGTQLQVSRVWQSYKILENGPDRARFEVTYAPWQVGDRKVWETRTLTLEAGSQLSRIESVFHSDNAGELTIGIGIAKAKGDAPTQDAAMGTLATWKDYGANGALGCAVLVEPKLVVGTAQDEKNWLILARAQPEQPLVYHAGAGWNQSGYVRNSPKWLESLANFKRAK